MTQYLDGYAGMPPNNQLSPYGLDGLQSFEQAHLREQLQLQDLLSLQQLLLADGQALQVPGHRYPAEAQHHVQLLVI